MVLILSLYLANLIAVIYVVHLCNCNKGRVEARFVKNLFWNMAKKRTSLY